MIHRTFTIVKHFPVPTSEKNTRNLQNSQFTKLSTLALNNKKYLQYDST